MANGVYNKGKFLALSGNLTTATDLRVLLVNAAYSFNPDHNFVSDVSANEISVSGYARQTLGSKTVTEDDTNDAAYLDAADATFTALASGQTIGGAVLYRFNASDSAAELIAFYDLTDTATNGGNITVQFDASFGILKLA